MIKQQRSQLHSIGRSLRQANAVAVAQSIKAFDPQAEDWVFESQLRQTVKTGSDRSTAKRLASGVRVTGPRR